MMRRRARHNSLRGRTLGLALALLGGASAIGVLHAVLQPTLLTIGNPAPQAGAGFGESVAGLGDVTDDGVFDLAVGAPNADRVYVFSGADRSLVRTIPDPEALTGNHFGFAVAPLGDVNGDGVGDLAVGAPGPFPGPVPLPCPVAPCPPPNPAWGRAFIFSGATGAMIRKITPVEDFVGFGLSVASLGDVTGDGRTDLAVGMVPLGVASAFGRVYAYSGATGAALWMTQEPGGRQLPSFGSRLAGLGDVTADGTRDLLVGAQFHDVNPDPAVTVSAGAAYVLSGATGAVVRTHNDPAPHDNDLFGIGLTGAGDQTGDGVEDYAIGEAGARLVHLVNGSSGAIVTSMTGPAGADSFGFFLAAVDDQSGDGRVDFWASAPTANAIYLLQWSGPTLATVTGPGPAASSGGFGWFMARTGNLGGDAPADLIVGRPADSSGSGKAFLVLLVDNTPPTADAGSDQIVECIGHTVATLDGSASSDPDGDALTYEWRDSSNTVVATTAVAAVPLGLGTHVFSLTVSDGRGGTDVDEVSITVRDTSPPTLTVSLSPAELWPADHKMVNITAEVAVTDACDAIPTIELVSIASSEPTDGVGDGQTTPDIDGAIPGTDDRAFRLRSERAGTGPGRIYTVTYRAVDASGNAAVVSAQVLVPHNR